MISVHHKVECPFGRVDALITLRDPLPKLCEFFCCFPGAASDYAQGSF